MMELFACSVKAFYTDKMMVLKARSAVVRLANHAVICPTTHCDDLFRHLPPAIVHTGTMLVDRPAILIELEIGRQVVIGATKRHKSATHSLTCLPNLIKLQILWHKASLNIDNDAVLLMEGASYMNARNQYSLTGSAPERYERNMVPAIFEPFAKGLLEYANLREGEHVLDVACGTGIVARLAWPLVTPGGRVVGLDVNAAMLDVARSVSEEAGISVEWQEGDVASMPISDSSFDVVLCQHGLQYFSERQAALREMHRLLRPSGRLVLSVWRPVEYNPSHAVFADVLERHVSKAAAATRRAPFALSDRDEIRALVAGADFHDVVLQLDVRVARFPSAEAMIRIMMAGTPLATAMSEADPAVLQTVIAEVTEGLAAYEDDQGLALPLQAWIVTARI